MEDRNARKFRIEQLKKNIKKENFYGELFEECIDSLGDKSRIYSREKSQELAKKMVDEFNFTKWGRVDWSLLQDKFIIDESSELVKYTTALDDNYFIIWNAYNIPVVEATIGDIIRNFEDIIAVGFDTWIVNFDKRINIENYHVGEITIGKK